jgi:transposase
MNMPHKFIKTLSDTEYSQLLENYQTSDNFGLRRRSHAILLSFQKYPIDEIANICQVHRTTVGIWIDNWNELGNQGLADAERSGRPPILTVEEQAKAIEIGLRNPKFPHRQLGEIGRETGKEISPFTLKRLIKKKTICGKESS